MYKYQSRRGITLTRDSALLTDAEADVEDEEDGIARVMS